VLQELLADPVALAEALAPHLAKAVVDGREVYRAVNVHDRAHGHRDEPPGDAQPDAP
jgi:hypothetical protein